MQSAEIPNNQIIIDEDAMNFVLRITYEAGMTFLSHTYFFDFIVDSEKNILSSPPGSGKTMATLQYLMYHLFLTTKQSSKNSVSLTKKKLIWSIPLKALAESIKSEALKIMTTSTFLKWYCRYNLKEGTDKHQSFMKLINERNSKEIQKFVDDKIGIVVGTGASHRISSYWLVILTYEHLGIFMTHPTIPFPDAQGKASKLNEEAKERYLESMTPQKSFFRIVIDEVHTIADRKRGLVIDQIISSCNFLKIKWVGISGTLPISLLKLLPPAHIVNFSRQNSLRMWEYDNRNGNIGKRITTALAVTIPSVSSIIYADNKNNECQNETPRVLVFVNSIKGCEKIFHEVVQTVVESGIISSPDIETYKPTFSLRYKNDFGTVTMKNGKKVDTISAGLAYGILISHAQLIIQTNSSGKMNSTCTSLNDWSSYENYKERISSYEGDWSTIISTTTLAVGVNLAPVTHVVINEEPNSIYWSQKELVQMIGRTGRTKDGLAAVIHDFNEFERTISCFTGYRASMRAFAKYILPLFASFSDIPPERASQSFSTFWTPRGFYDERMPLELKEKLENKRSYNDFINEYVSKLVELSIIKEKDTLISIYYQANKFDMNPENILVASLIGTHIADFSDDEILQYQEKYHDNNAYDNFQQLLVLYSSILIAGTRLSQEFRSICFGFMKPTLEIKLIDIPIDKNIQKDAIKLAAKITQQAADVIIGQQEMHNAELIARLIYHFSETGTIGVNKDILNDENEREKKKIISKNAIFFFTKCGMNFARFLYSIDCIVSIEANLLKSSEFRNVRQTSGINSAWRIVLEYVDDAISSDTRKWESVTRRMVKNGSNRIPCEIIFTSLFTESEDDKEINLLSRKEVLRNEKS